ncbi:hypothetical protein ACFX16_025815 [Malus domestica]
MIIIIVFILLFFIFSIIAPTRHSSAPSLWSSCSAHRLRPLLFSKRRRRTGLSYWHFNPLKPKHLSVAASENGVFTSPEIAKTFDFTSEERIYNWWES